MLKLTVHMYSNFLRLKIFTVDHDSNFSSARLLRKMRLRIETAPPLRPLKTWLTAAPGIFGRGTRTINDLRRRLIAEFGLPNEIQLQLQGYDLLEKDSIQDVLEKDDLVMYTICNI